jgi:hypothetical protein
MAVAKFSDLEYRMTEIEEQIRERDGNTDQARLSKARPAQALPTREPAARWSVPRCIPLPLVPCPASRPAWHNLVKRQAQEPPKQVFGDDAV